MAADGLAPDDHAEDRSSEASTESSSSTEKELQILKDVGASEPATADHSNPEFQLCPSETEPPKHAIEPVVSLRGGGNAISVEPLIWDDGAMADDEDSSGDPVATPTNEGDNHNGSDENAQNSTTSTSNPPPPSTDNYFTRNNRPLHRLDYSDQLKALGIRPEKWRDFMSLLRGFLRNQRYARLLKSIPGISYTRDRWSDLEGPYTNYEICRLMAQGFFTNHASKIYNVKGTEAGWLQDDCQLNYEMNEEEIVKHLHAFFYKLRMNCMTWDSPETMEDAANEHADYLIEEGKDREIITSFINKVREAE